MAEPAIAAAWAPRGPWAGIASAGRVGIEGAAGVTATLCEGLAIATLIVAEGGEAALAAALKARSGLALPDKPRVQAADGAAIIWAGVGQWLLVCDSRAGFAEILAALAPHAAVSDQSDGRATLRLSGTKIREALAKGVMVDLHPSVFPVGATALTSIAHIGVHILRIEDGPDGPVFEIMVPRSMAGSFWSWFSASAAEFGCQVLTSRTSTAGISTGRG